jgi:hypothetical protein
MKGRQAACGSGLPNDSIILFGPHSCLGDISMSVEVVLAVCQGVVYSATYVLGRTK